LRDHIVVGVEAPELIQEGPYCGSCSSKMWSCGVTL